MSADLAWPIVVFVIVGLTLWRLDRFSRQYLQIMSAANTTANEAAEVALIERRTKAAIAHATIDETTACERAELRRKTAEANVVTSVAEDFAFCAARNSRSYHQSPSSRCM